MLLLSDARVRETLGVLFGGKTNYDQVRSLKLEPAIPTHRNGFNADALVLPVSRFAGQRELPLVPLMRRVVDRSVEAFSRFFPQIADQVGKTPISPHGSMVFSVRRWGFVDWDFVRDLDWRLYLPPQIGHESGFLSHLQSGLEQELRDAGLQPVFRGKDPDGRPQVQLRDAQSGAIHGFHLFLLSMEPGFVNLPLHEGGGYSIHQPYFPEDSIEPYLVRDRVLWDRLILRHHDHYDAMFRRIAFNTFGGDDLASVRLKTKGWYSRKAFKWYAALANVRGLTSLEDEIVSLYQCFNGTHEDLVHLVRRHYFALLDPASSGERGRLEREISATLSLAYSRARTAAGDVLTGQQTSDEEARVVVLEPADRRWLSDAVAYAVSQANAQSGLQTTLEFLRELTEVSGVRFADGVGDPLLTSLPGNHLALLLPSAWSFVYTDTYAIQTARAASEAGLAVTAADCRLALVALLASHLIKACDR